MLLSKYKHRLTIFNAVDTLFGEEAADETTVNASLFCSLQHLAGWVQCVHTVKAFIVELLIRRVSVRPN